MVADLRLDLIQLGNRSHLIEMDAVAGPWCVMTPPVGTDPGRTMRETHQAAIDSRDTSLVSTTHGPLQQFSVLPEASFGVAGHDKLLKEVPTIS